MIGLLLMLAVSLTVIAILGLIALSIVCGAPIQAAWEQHEPTCPVPALLDPTPTPPPEARATRVEMAEALGTIRAYTVGAHCQRCQFVFGVADAVLAALGREGRT